MPYLTEERKREIDKLEAKLTTAGDLTYKLTTTAMSALNTYNFDILADKFTFTIAAYMRPSSRYEDYAVVLGCLDSTRREIKRRLSDLVQKGHARHMVEIICWMIKKYAEAYYAEVVAPYENSKIIQNGDVF